MFGANSQFGSLIPGGLAGLLGQQQQQQFGGQPQQQSLSPTTSLLGAPMPTGGQAGRIPVSTMGGDPGSLASLFAAVDKGVKASTGAGAGGAGLPGAGDKAGTGTTINGYYIPSRDEEIANQQAYNKALVESGMFAKQYVNPTGTAAGGKWVLKRKPYAEGGNLPSDAASAASTAAGKDAEAFLKSLGLGGSSSTGVQSPTSSALSSRSSATPLAAAAAPVPTGEPGRIPVSTGTASTPGSITTKPSGVSSSDWSKYKSLSSKLQPGSTHAPISDKNQKWYDAFVAKYGVATPPAGGGGGGGVIPGGVAPPPGPVNPDLGLLTRPYVNPFEQRNLWNLFPQQAGGQ